MKTPIFLIPFFSTFLPLAPTLFNHNHQDTQSFSPFNVRIISRTLDSINEVDKVYQTVSHNDSLVFTLKRDPTTFGLSDPFKLLGNPLKFGHMVNRIGQTFPQWNNGQGSWWGLSIPPLNNGVNFNNFNFDKWDENNQEVPYHQWKSPIGIDDLIIKKDIVIVFVEVKATDNRWQSESLYSNINNYSFITHNQVRA